MTCLALTAMKCSPLDTSISVLGTDCAICCCCRAELLKMDYLSSCFASSVLDKKIVPAAARQSLWTDILALFFAASRTKLLGENLLLCSLVIPTCTTWLKWLKLSPGPLLLFLISGDSEWGPGKPTNLFYLLQWTCIDWTGFIF